jgi:thiosulfate/3-mercaptopyruvate sulfurtransferase
MKPLTTQQRRLFAAVLLFLLHVPIVLAQNAHIPASSIPTADLIQPADFAATLQSATPKPLILQVGSHVLFAEAHIPGAEYAGPTNQEAGLQILKDRVATLSKDTDIVLYCGCCPWDRCPNIAPAYNQLHAMGFTHLKVLYIADNFDSNWVAKGYPVAKGRS